MNLLLRVIIPALDSNSGDLVNLGLRTLEFWVDNLNPLFLVPEISKQTEVFTSLMQSLSRHLRPAPYPYGLLTLRLLGKLGGKNRQFLREPFVCSDTQEGTDGDVVTLKCHWTAQGASNPEIGSIVNLPLPIGRCVSILRMIATSRNSLCRENDPDASCDDEKGELVSWNESDHLWTIQIDRIDMAEYQRDLMLQTKRAEASSCVSVLLEAARATEMRSGERLTESASQDVQTILLGLLYAAMVDSTRDDALESLKKLVSLEIGSALRNSLSVFLLEADPKALSVAIDVLQFLAISTEQQAEARLLFYEDLLMTLCKACATSNWDERESLYGALHYLVDVSGPEQSRKNELELITAAFVSVKSVPSELSNACAVALRFFFGLCVRLYGRPWSAEGSVCPVIWDALETGMDDSDSTHSHTSVSIEHRPCDHVIRLVLVEIAASQDVVRYVYLVSSRRLLSTPH
jgi:transformation/transcription domain-associated protein